MIIEFIQQKNSFSRGAVGSVINYIFDVNKNGFPKYNKKMEDVEFIGTSGSICAVDPFYTFRTIAPSELIKLDLNDIKDAFVEIEEKNKRVKHPFLHIVFSLREGESLTKSQWNELVCHYVERLGYGNNHWVSCIHKNTENEHAHLVLSCIENSIPHRKTKDSLNYARSAEIRAELELKFGLQPDNNPIVTGQLGNSLNNASTKPKAQSIRAEIDDVIKTHDSSLAGITLPRFIQAMSDKGIGCFAKLKGKLVAGLSFSTGLDTFPAGSLGIGYDWNSLQKRGVRYDENLHYSDVVYENQKEHDLMQLMSNASKNTEPQFGSVNSQFQLVLPSEEVNKYPLNKELHKYALFDFTRKLNTNNIHGLRQIRKVLSKVYELVKCRTNGAYNDLKTGVADLFVKFVQEVDSTSLIAQKLKQPSNHKFLSRMGMLLIANRKAQDSSTIAMQLEPVNNQVDTNISLTVEQECQQQDHVKVFGDYRNFDNRKKASIPDVLDNVPAKKTNAQSRNLTPSELGF